MGGCYTETIQHLFTGLLIATCACAAHQKQKPYLSFEKQGFDDRAMIPPLWVQPFTGIKTPRSKPLSR